MLNFDMGYGTYGTYTWNFVGTFRPYIWVVVLYFGYFSSNMFPSPFLVSVVFSVKLLAPKNPSYKILRPNGRDNGGYTLED